MPSYPVSMVRWKKVQQKHKDVMSENTERKTIERLQKLGFKVFEIDRGPGFREFVNDSPIVASEGTRVRLTIKHPDHKDTELLDLFITVLGKPETFIKGEYIFAGWCYGDPSTHDPGHKSTWAGRYNLRGNNGYLFKVDSVMEDNPLVNLLLFGNPVFRKHFKSSV
jgi:hypothetical protein